MRRIALLLGFFVALASLSTFATPIISLVPQFQKVHPLQNLNVDVVISGLQPGGTDSLLAAFDLTIHYNANYFVFLPANSALGTGLGDPADPSQTVIGGDNSTAGIFQFYEVSLLEPSASTCVFCTGPYLADLQSDTFSLASLTFYYPGPAPSQPSLANFIVQNADLSDPLGNPIPFTTRNASVIVAPEPSDLAIFGSALLVLVTVKKLGRRM